MRYLPLFAAIFAITPLAIDMYLPGMPQIALSLDAPITQVQNSLSIYLGGYAFGMFLFGPLVDRFGRRPLLLMGLAGFVVFSLAIVYCVTIEQFLLFRCLQAMAGSAATVVIPGAIRELFGKDTAKGLSYVSMIMMVAPMLAPAIGGGLLLVGDWRLIFSVLALYGGIIWLVAFLYFPQLESPEPKSATDNLSFIKRYQAVLASATSRRYLAISMLTSLVFFTYVTSVSFWYMQVMGFNEQEFSLLFALNVVGMMMASFLNTRLVPRLGSAKILRVASIFALCWSLLLAISIFLHAPAAIVVGCLVMMIATAMLIISNADALILIGSGKQSGTATAVIGSLRFGAGAMAGPILALMYDGSAMPIGTLILACLLLTNLVLWFGRKTHQEGLPSDA